MPNKRKSLQDRIDAKLAKIESLQKDISKLKDKQCKCNHKWGRWYKYDYESSRIVTVWWSEDTFYERILCRGRKHKCKVCGLTEYEKNDNNVIKILPKKER